MTIFTSPTFAFFLLIIKGITSSAIEHDKETASGDMRVMNIINDLQRKLEIIEEKQNSLSNNLLQVEDKLKDRDDNGHSRQKRQVRDSETQQGLPSLSTNRCVPGTPGCSVNVVPYSAGASCILCPAGPRGYIGPPGVPGRDGRDGRDALTIVTSNDGDRPGTVVPSCSSNTERSNTSGVTYVRWGHKDCPTSSTLIYSGSAGGPQYGADGNGANQLCLPPDPVYEEPVSGVGGARAFIYGIEYQIDSFPQGIDSHYHDLPCTVCQASSRYSKLMVPAKNVCPSEAWTLEYAGYLMAERSQSGHKRSMYICVDREMQVVERTHGRATDGTRALLDLVESRCVTSGGGLPCGPYIDGYELTCAVCTQ